ncbi:hypothetical protein Pla52o_07380 [Novipirellula galeiformis]|uniref:Uncharacterized protein n=1 Tax=Novipirellula galeiformis TaxID=2528004 RepID=A0A5C6CPH4_9BACT|nr:hypothetical protein [Novipirellula galeiformis]TWU26883.1 hypothetical protein Pla52o_07380 [Novipirellula galeiformis]
MRNVSIIAVVTRFFASNEVRVIRNAVSTTVASCLHRWQTRMHLGMPCYTGSRSWPTGSPLLLSDLSDRDLLRLRLKRGLKTGNPSGYQSMAAADYPAGIGRS